MSHDQEIFARWIEPEVPWLVAYLAGLTQSRALAEELAQETLVRAFRAAGRYDPSRSRDGFSGGWLRTIARNLYYNHLRDRRQDQPINEATTAVYERAFQAIDQADEARRLALRRCFEDLPVRLAGVCRAHYFDEQPAPRIAEQEGLSIDAVRKRLQRAREALRNCIQRRLRSEEPTA